MPNVSVVIAAYNAEQHIQESILSVLNQTYPYWELIIVDDGSTDGTFEQAKQAVDAHPSQVSLLRKENGGSASARNLGIRNAQGQCVAFLDSDDLWYPQFLEKHVEHLDENPSISVSYSWLRYIDARGRILPESRRPCSDGDVLAELALSNFLTPCSTVLRRTPLEDVGLFDERLRTREDWDLWLRLAAESALFKCIPEELSLYRVHDSNKLSTMDTSKQLQNQLALLDSFYGREGLPESIRRLRPRAYSNLYVDLAVMCYGRDDDVRALEMIDRAVEYWPEVLTQQDPYYRIACANQPAGYRNSEYFRDMDRAVSRIGSMIDHALPYSPSESGDRSTHDRAWTSASVALAKQSYASNDLANARRFALQALRKDASHAYREGVIGIGLRSLLGRERVSRFGAVMKRAKP